MKILLLLVLTVLAGSTQIQTEGSNMTLKVSKLIEEFRPIIATGDRDIGIPVLDPLSLKNLVFNIQTNELSIKANVVTAKVTGISGFVVNSIKQNDDASVAVSLSLRSLKASGEYSSSGAIKTGFINLPVTGKGSFTITVSGIECIATLGGAELDTSNKLSVQSLGIVYSLKRITVNLTGLSGGTFINNAVNKFINKMAIPIEQREHSKIVSVLEKVSLKEVKWYLAKVQTTSSS